jgi:hypothetical protein
MARLIVGLAARLRHRGARRRNISFVAEQSRA